MSIAETSPQHHFAGNMTASAVLTLGEVLTMLDPSPSSPETVTSCHDYPLISSAPDSGCRYYTSSACRIQNICDQLPSNSCETRDAR